MSFLFNVQPIIILLRIINDLTLRISESFLKTDLSGDTESTCMPSDKNVNQPAIVLNLNDKKEVENYGSNSIQKKTVLRYSHTCFETQFIIHLSLRLVIQHHNYYV